MANWPAQADYRDALQNPDVAFRDAALRRAQVEVNRMKVPRARSGAFASVYKLTRADGQSVALKLFNFPSADRQRRYEEVSKHLAGLSDRKPDSLVGFAYQREGIRIGGSWYPIQTMDWVKGVSLGEWVRERAAAGDAAGVRRMADKWQQLVGKLQAADIAHGDLQHDNVMVRDGTPILVDYDGMWVPNLDGAEPLEFGKPAYQHPRRGEMKLNRGLDHFSAWVILIALRATAADLGLYTRFVVRPDNENVLFSPADLTNHAKSELWPELLRCKDAEVSRWAADLRACLDHPADRVPPFTMDPFQSIRALCEAPAPDWDAIASEADRLTTAKKLLPAEPKHVFQRVGEAKLRVVCRDRIRQAFQAGDVRAMVAAYQPALLAHWPNQRGLVNQVEAAVGKVKMLDELKAAGADEQRLADLWAKYGPTLGGVKEAEPYGKRVESVRSQLKAAQPFLTLFRDAGASEQALAKSWKAVVAAGEHSALITPAHRERGELAVHRCLALDRFKGIPATPSESADRQLVQMWAACETALTGCKEADPLRARAAQAKMRLAAVDAVDAALSQLGTGGRADDVIRAASVAVLPTGYAYKSRDLAERLKDGLRLQQELRSAIEAAPPSELKIAAVYQRLIGDRLRSGFLSADLVSRGELAVKRASAVGRLEECRKVQPLDRRDVMVLAIFKEVRGDLRDSPDPVVTALVEWVSGTYARLKKWNELKAALDQQDAGKVARLGRDPEMTSYPPVVARHADLVQLLRAGEKLSGVWAKLKAAATHPQTVLTEDELATVRGNHQMFTEAEKQDLLCLARVTLRQLAKLAPGTPAHQRYPGEPPVAKVFWSWSSTPAVSRFVLTVTPERLSNPTDAPERNRSHCRPEDHTRDGGGRLVVLDGVGPLYVQVWPEANLGFATVHSDPLTFGPIAAGGGR